MIAALIVAALTLGGCAGIIGSIVTTQDDIRNAGLGFTSVKVGLADNDTDLTVSASSAVAPSAAGTKEIAGIVWRDIHVRFGSLRVQLHGAGQTTVTNFSFAALSRLFGARKPAYDKTTLRQSLLHFGIVVLIIVVVLIVLIVLTVLYILRRRRRRRQLLGAGPTWGGPQSGGVPQWGQGGPQPGGAAPQWGADAWGSPPSGPGSWGQGPPAGADRAPGASGSDPWGRPVGSPPDEAN
jgi:hypothetical protein